MLHLHTLSQNARLKIGLLGGSFNPAHDGHRAMSLHALKALGLDQIWWLVSPQNPLKSSDNMAPLTERAAAAQKCARHPRIIVTDIESELGTRYTADTLYELRRRCPKARFVWLMGADNLRQITRWHHWESIFSQVPVAVFRRPAYAAGRGIGKAAQRFRRNWLPARQGKILVTLDAPAWLVMNNRRNNLSATNIRKDLPTWQR